MSSFKLTSPVSAVPPEFSILSIARMLWKQKIVICLATAAIAGIAMYEIRNLPPVYQAEAIILVDRQKIPEKLVASTVNANVQDRLSYISEQILSSRRLTAVLTDFDLFPGEKWQRTPEEYAERIRQDITVGTDKPGPRARPGVIRLGFRGSNRNVVASVANRLANLFIEENLKTREVMAEGTTEFIESQLQLAKKELDAQEASLSQYKIQFNGELPQQEQQLSGSLARLQVALEANRDALNRTTQNIIQLENSISAAEAEDRLQGQAASIRSAALADSAPRRNGTPGIGRTAVPATPQKQSEVLAAQLRDLRSKYGDGHPDIRRVQAVLDQTLRVEKEQEAAAPPRTTVSASTEIEPVAPVNGADAVNAELAKLNAEGAKLRSQDRVGVMRAQIEQNRKEFDKRTREQEQITKNIAVYQARLERLPLREQQMAQVTRDHASAAANYQSLLEKRIGAEMASELERRQKSERFTLIEPARVPDVPVSPNRPLLNMIAAAAALLIGALIGVLLEFRKGKLLGDWELDPSIVVLANLPRIQLSGGDSLWATLFRKKWKAGATAASVVIGALWMRLF